MAGKVGDHISIDSDKAGSPPRKGVILEVLEESYGTRYRVSWDDGHETTIHPVPGTVEITPAKREPSAIRR